MIIISTVERSSDSGAMFKNNHREL